jgi:membrane-associated phospholipid phosphatase
VSARYGTDAIDRRTWRVRLCRTAAAAALATLAFAATARAQQAGPEQPAVHQAGAPRAASADSSFRAEREALTQRSFRASAASRGIAIAPVEGPAYPDSVEISVVAADLPALVIPPLDEPHGGVSTLRLGLGLGAAAIAIAPFDVAITRKLRSPGLQQNTAWHNGAVVFDWYGAPGARAVGPLLAVAGSVARNSMLSDIGIHVSESYAASALVVYTLKGFAGRARPYSVSSESAYDFRFGRGFPHDEPYSSFPSGHATGSFAFASSLTVEAARRWPSRKVLIGALAFSGAFLDGVSRVYRDTHWPSDVAAAALVGTLSGIVVTRHQHAHPDNRLDAFARRLLFAPAADGRSAIGIAATF